MPNPIIMPYDMDSMLSTIFSNAPSRNGETPDIDFDVENPYVGEPIIYRYHSAYRPHVYFCGGENVTDLYMGIELEFDTRQRMYATRQNKMDLIDCSNRIWGNNTFAYYMLDRSIRNGLEMITQPATYEYHYANRDKYEALFKEITRHGFKSHSLKNCGLHIHFNRLYFGDDTSKCDDYIRNLLTIADKFWRELVLCSRRNYESLQRWAKKHEKSPDDTIMDMKELYRLYGIYPHAQKYYAINLINRYTIEFRMYRGTLEIDDFFATLELTKNIIEASKNLTKEQIVNLDFSYFVNTSDNLSKYYKRCNRKASVERLPDFLRKT